MTVGAVIQARTGSSRLPGKVLAQLAGRPVLAWIVDRLRAAELVDTVIVATTVRSGDDAVADLTDELGVACFRGSEHDVLERYHATAVAHRLSAVVRITADCPLIDPDVVDEVVRAWHAAQPSCDFAANTLVRRYPRGLDVAVVASEALARAWREAEEPFERAHVTPYLRAPANGFTHCSVEAPIDLSGLRWTLDEPADLEFLREIYRRLAPFPDYSWERVYELLQREPHLARINDAVRQKALHEG